MVYSKPSTSSGAMKRSASVLEGPPTWDAPPPMMNPSRSFRLPYAHYAMIYLDHDGKLKVEESPSLNEQNATVFTPDVRQNFLEILGERIGYQPSAPRRVVEASPRRVRRRRGNADTTIESRIEEEPSDNDDFSPNGSTEMVPLRVGDFAKVSAYYQGALKHFQQLNCRMVAKAFIKFIEPRKQVRHPYNGGKPPPGSAPGTTGDPEMTKPEWWPKDVMHKEPDHLRKEYRIDLLIHIIRNLGPHGITADKLKEVAGDTKRSLKHPSHVDIIYEILRVRKMEERFERGEVDANMVCYVMNRGPSPKSDEDEETNDLAAHGASDHLEDGILTPTSSVEQVTAPLTTPMEPLPMSNARSLPGSFSMSDGLSFDNRQDRPYYTSPTQYPDSFSQTMLSTPVSAEMISPHEVSVFDYSQNPFPSSSPDQPRSAAPSHYDAWGPSFRPNMFAPVDYTATGAVPPPMSYHLPMAPSASLHDMSHHPHMDPRPLPFRNGSLPNGLPIPHHA